MDDLTERPDVANEIDYCPACGSLHIDWVSSFDCTSIEDGAWERRCLTCGWIF